MCKDKPAYATNRFWLHLLVSYQVEHSKKNSISTRAIYYSLFII